MPTEREVMLGKLEVERVNLTAQLDQQKTQTAALAGALQFCNHMIDVLSSPDDASPKEHTHDEPPPVT